MVYYATIKGDKFGCHIRPILKFDDHISAKCRSIYFHLMSYCTMLVLLLFMHLLVVYYIIGNSILYKVPKNKIDQLQRLQNQCVYILIFYSVPSVSSK